MDRGQIKSVFLEAFEEWLAKNINSKSNQLNYSNQFIPNRTFVETYSLATARDQYTAQLIPTQFKSARVESIFQTSAPTTEVNGSVKILFDYKNLGNVKNAITLKANDSFVMDTLVAQAFLVNDAQADTSIRIAYFVDIDFRPGSTLITGSVTVNNTMANAVPTKLIPSSIVRRSFSGVNGNSAADTVPVGFYGILSYALNAWSNNGNISECSISVNAVILANASNNNTGNSTVAGNSIRLVAGDAVITTTPANTGGTYGARASYHLELYPI